MMLRLGAGAGATGGAGGRGASEGDGGEGQAEGVGRGSCGAGWGVLGLELPVDTALTGTTGDWEPEDGLCPLAASGDVWPRLRASIISRKLGAQAGVRKLPSCLSLLFLVTGVPVLRPSSLGTLPSSRASLGQRAGRRRTAGQTGPPTHGPDPACRRQDWR